MNDRIGIHLGQDQIMKEIIRTTILPDLELHNDLYKALIRSIVFQQLSGKAAETIHGRLLDLFKDRYPHTDQLIALDLPQLRSAGLSRQKASYIQNVAHFFQEHHSSTDNWQNWSDEALISHFTQIKGVGKWTVQMILMFSLGRPDVFPVDDLGIQQAMSKAYDLKLSGKQLKVRITEIANFWRPYRSYASRLLWRWLDS